MEPACIDPNIIALNGKALYDRAVQDLFAKAPLPNAWELLSQRLVSDGISLSNRVNNLHATIDGLILGGLAAANQTGTTENQAAVTPIRTGAADTQVQQPAGSVYPPIRNVDQGGAAATNAELTSDAATSVAAAGVATANQAIADALAQFIALMNQGAAALQAVLVTAAGGASTPSQTQPKPAGS
jgi:hypothetical protein